MKLFKDYDRLIKFAQDENGNVASVTDSDGTIIFDESGRSIGSINPDIGDHQTAASAMVSPSTSYTGAGVLGGEGAAPAPRGGINSSKNSDNYDFGNHHAFGDPIDWTTPPSSPEEAQERVREAQRELEYAESIPKEVQVGVDGDGNPIMEPNPKYIQAQREAQAKYDKAQRDFAEVQDKQNSASNNHLNEEIENGIKEAERERKEAQDRVEQAQRDLENAYSMQPEPIYDENGNIIGMNEGPRNDAIAAAQKRLDAAKANLVESEKALANAKDALNDADNVLDNISGSSRGEIEEALRNTEDAIKENTETLDQFKQELEQKKIEMEQLQQQLAQAQQQLAAAEAMSCTPIPCPEVTNGY